MIIDKRDYYNRGSVEAIAALLLGAMMASSAVLVAMIFVM